MEKEELGVVVIGRAEIDTRQPFQSVKEAVMLFGERVLAGEVYANKLKEMQAKASEQGQQQSRIAAVSAELEEAKQSLQKANEDGHFLAHCLASLKQELEETRRELQKLKTRELVRNQPVDPEIEELKFVENPNVTEYFQKRRSVKFASPPALIIASNDIGETPKETIPPNNSKNNMKRKQLISLFGRLFRKKQ